MDELPADLKAFLLNHPFLQLTDGNKVSGLQTLMLAVWLLSVPEASNDPVNDCSF